jgi:hypothetical protein
VRKRGSGAYSGEAGHDKTSQQFEPRWRLPESDTWNMVSGLRCGSLSMRGRYMAAAILLGVAAPLVAHDFWIQPLKFAYPAAPQAVPVRIFVGHGAARERWGLTIDRVVQFNSIGPDGLVDRKDRMTLNNGPFDALVQFRQSGAYVLSFQSVPTTSDLPYLRFNDYVAQEGITPIAMNRRRTGTEKTNGRELYSRRAKAIVQVGPVTPADIARVTRPVGLQLEIVPDRHPNTLNPGDKLPVRVLFDRRPLAGAMVKLTNLDDDAKPVATARTDAAGRAVFTVPARGAWQFNIVWSQVMAGNAAADYRTVFSSLTFGI